MTSKLKYKNFIKDHGSVPLFFQDWYLDLCTEREEWDVIIVEDQGEVKMCLPYFHKQKYFFHFVSMPHLCKFMGPVFAKGYTPNSEQLIAVYNQIPSHSFLQQNIHYHASRPVLDSFPESVSTGQSFVIDLSLSEEALWNRLASDYRNNKIKKARMKVELSFAMTVEDFYQLNVKSFSNQRANFPVPPRLFKSIISGLVEKKSAILIGVCDKSGHFHAGACIAWDSNSVYYHSAGTDPNLRSSGGGILLIWEAIRWAKEHHQNKQFDFLGSNIKGIARVWKNFGAKKKEYVILTRERSTFFKYLRKLKYKLT